MTDKQYQEIKSTIERIYKHWHDQTGFGWWKVDLTYVRGEKENNADTAAETQTSWNYRSAHITFYLGVMRGMPFDEIENTVVHELCHILVAPMHQANDDQSEEQRQIMEFTTTCIANAMVWAGYMPRLRKKRGENIVTAVAVADNKELEEK